MVTIIPTFPPKNIADFEAKFYKIAGLCDRVQIDIVDGVYAPEKTIGPEELARVDTIVNLEAHLMVDEPAEWVERVVRGGFMGAYGQMERMSDPVKFLADGQVAGLKMGLALELETEVSKLEPYIWDVDGVLLLAVKGGDSGRTFDPGVLPKIAEVRKLRRDVAICVDGGLDVGEIKKCIVAEWAEEIREEDLNKDFLGIEFAVGSHLLNVEDVSSKLEELRHLKA